MENITFRDFLKKYSLLTNEFIDDFYNIYEYDENNNANFIIDLEVVSKWLDSYKHKLKKTLVKSYILSFDYIIKLEKNAKISKSNKEIILLTPDCFKRLCLMSKTRKAEEVRSYYLELEKLLNNYKNYIIKGLQKTINILENNQKEKPKNIKGVVYILQSPKDIDGIYRFGKTNDFNSRINNYNSANSDKMKIIKIFETKNIDTIEKCVIEQIKPLRYKKRKDFYQIDLKILTSVIKDCQNLTLKYKGKIDKKTSKKNSKKTSKKILTGGEYQNYYLYIKK
jgi:phage anti-repressor protein